MNGSTNPWVARFANRPHLYAARTLVGQGGGDYNITDLLGTPTDPNNDLGPVSGGIQEAKDAWGQVQNQLAVENTPSSDISDVKHAFVDAYNELNKAGSYDNAGDLANAAGKYIKAGRTIAGAIENVEGLISAAQSGTIPPQELMQTFMGTMIGILAAAGVITAGVGAVIMAAVGAVMALFSALGLFGGGPPGEQVCPGVTVSPAPTGVIGSCLVVDSTAPTVTDPQTGKTGPMNWPAPTGTPLWRHFPIAGNPDDNLWFQQPVPRGYKWPTKHADGTPYQYPDYWSSNACSTSCRMIDDAFWEYRFMECDQASLPCAPGSVLGLFTIQTTATLPPELQALCGFMQAFFTAWRANKEYVLNGLVPKYNDWQVLQHVVRLWNRAHQPGNGYLIQQANQPSLNYSPSGVVQTTSTPGEWGVNTYSSLPGCATGSLPYTSFLVQQMYQQTKAGTPEAKFFEGMALRINTGPKVPVSNVAPRSISLNLGGLAKIKAYDLWNLQQWVDYYTPLEQKLAAAQKTSIIPIKL